MLATPFDRDSDPRTAPESRAGSPDAETGRHAEEPSGLYVPRRHPKTKTLRPGLY